MRAFLNVFIIVFKKKKIGNKSLLFRGNFDFLEKNNKTDKYGMKCIFRGTFIITHLISIEIYNRIGLTFIGCSFNEDFS